MRDTIRTTAGTQTELLSHMLPHVRLWRAGGQGAALYKCLLAACRSAGTPHMFVLWSSHTDTDRFAGPRRPSWSRWSLFVVSAWLLSTLPVVNLPSFLGCYMAALLPAWGGGGGSGREEAGELITGADPASLTGTNTMTGDTTDAQKCIEKKERKKTSSAHTLNNIYPAQLHTNATHPSAAVSRDSWYFYKRDKYATGALKPRYLAAALCTQIKGKKEKKRRSVGCPGSASVQLPGCL